MARKQKEELVDDRSKGLLQNKSFWVRTLSGIVMTAVLIAVFVLGGYVMWAFLLALSLVGEFEFNRALKLHWGVFAWVGYIATVAYYILLVVLGSEFMEEFHVGCPVVALGIKFFSIVSLDAS